MARHELPAKDPDHKVIIGWDGDFAAFIGIVWHREALMRSLQGRPGIPIKRIIVESISDLRERLRPYAEFDQGMFTKLKADRGPR